MKVRRPLLVLLAVSVLLGASFQDFKRERSAENAKLKDALEGKPPPTLKVKEWVNLSGNAPSWKSLKGKVVLLDFWAWWCGPCRASVPHLKELLQRYKDQGLVVIGIHCDPDFEKMKQVVKELGMTWLVAQDGERKLMNAFHADSFPDYYLVDRAGNLRFADLANNEVDRAVETLIKEKPGK